ncbi:MAG TPA: glycoside hydrolase family 9 protein, partial [Polyangiaceae bacterium]|nr:glycoside hydrolase family 9 protein [Polyangiaceae bacterium]
NNDDAKQPGSKGLAAGQQEVDDKGRLAFKVEAAAYLFERTGEESYRDFFDKNYATVTPNYASYWEIERHEAALDYAMQKGATASVVSDIKSKFLAQIKGEGAVLQSATTHQEAYRAPLSDYTWGSNQVKAGAGRLLLLIEDYELEPATAPAARAAAADYLHYLHGVNPLGLVFLTNMDKAGAENSAKTLYHTWFAYRSAKWQEVGATTPGPAPGFLVGGPNPSYTLDGCCTDGSKCYGSADFSFCSLALAPPLDQPPAKSYLQFNHGWPANSWAVTENSNGYQVQYIRLLSSFID